MIIQANGSVKSEEYLRYIICKEFGWDYYTYEAQPPSFLEEIYIFMVQENNRERRAMNKQESTIKKGQGGMMR